MVDFLKKILNTNKFSSYEIPINFQDAANTDWKFCGIYKITNKINGKVYIGQAVNVKKRLQSHLAAVLRKKNLPLYNAINKHGINQFEVQVILVLNIFGKTPQEIKQELNALECFYIGLYNSYKTGYNATPGGDSGRLGFKHSAETILKMKEAHKNYTPRVARDVSKPTHCYDTLYKVFIDSSSVSDMANKTCADLRSIGQICNNTDYKNGGRFIANKRFLFAFTKEELLERINWFYSEQYNYNKKHRKNGRL